MVQALCTNNQQVSEEARRKSLQVNESAHQIVPQALVLRNPRRRWNKVCTFKLEMISPDLPPPSESEWREVNARRRFLRGGLAAGPVVATIASRPVLGATACAQASAIGSIATSGR